MKHSNSSLSSLPQRFSRTNMMLLTVLLSSLMLCSNATKHRFYAIRDHRTFIGPIGAPFGFLINGEYTLEVSQFQLKLKDHHYAHNKINKMKRNNANNNNINTENDSMNEFVKDLHPGFLLKRFENENEFARFQDKIYDNVTQCGFEDFIQGGEFAEDDDNFIGINKSERNSNDDTITETKGNDYYNVFDDGTAKGKGVIDGGEKGVFLSMKNEEHMWFTNKPSLNHKFTIDEEGYYFLFYQVCLTKTGTPNSSDLSKFAFKEITSNFILDFHYMNYDSFGRVSYLTAGEMPLPHIYLYFTISYIIMLIIWVQSIKVDSSGNKPTIYAIHHLMSSVVFLKLLTMLIESIRYHYIRVVGHAKVWSFMYYLINFLKGTFLFTVILLIGSGWSFFKPFLSKKERIIILFVMVLQIIDNIALAVLSTETENERSYNEWSTILHLVDIVSCCAVLIPIVWQVNNLEESVDVSTDADADADTAKDEMNTSSFNNHTEIQQQTLGQRQQPSRLQSKLDLFRSFYLIVVGYIYFTRIIIYLFASSLNYRHTWIRYFVYELGTLTFYFVVGMKLKPVVEDVPYSRVDTVGDDGVEMGEMMAALKSDKVSKD